MSSSWSRSPASISRASRSSGTAFTVCVEYEYVPPDDG